MLWCIETARHLGAHTEINLRSLSQSMSVGFPNPTWIRFKVWNLISQLSFSIDFPLGIIGVTPGVSLPVLDNNPFEMPIQDGRSGSLVTKPPFIYAHSSTPFTWKRPLNEHEGGCIRESARWENSQQKHTKRYHFLFSLSLSAPIHIYVYKPVGIYVL